MDMISELPEAILHNILSLLPFDEVVRTSVLSKRWERAWRTYPVLEFDEAFFSEYSYVGYYDVLDKVAQRRRNELYNCLAETMWKRHKEMISIKKFTLILSLSDDGAFASFVDQCVFHAVGCNVNELKLLLGPTYGDVKYNLPPIVSFAKSMEVLKLESCKMESPRNDLMLSSLRRLRLSHVLIDDDTIQNLVGGCPLIEHLTIEVCEGFKRLELVGLKRLNKIKLLQNFYVERLDIKASNVRELKIARPDYIHEINLASCNNLTRFILSSSPITDVWLCNIISKLPVLEFLSICDCNKLRSITISSSSLQELCLYTSRTFPLVELKIDTPNLRSLIYRGAVMSLSSNAPTLSEINFNFRFDDVETQKYFKFLANFHHLSEVLSVEVAKSEVVMVPRELRQTLSSPLSRVKHFNLKFHTSPTDFSIAKLVDSLLWSAPHTKTISIKYGYLDEYSFEFIYKKQPIHDGETASCCKFLPISCWEHCMEAVQVEFTSRLVNTVRCFLKGPRIWERIVPLCEAWVLMYPI